jgi:hypothetical protein
LGNNSGFDVGVSRDESDEYDWIGKVEVNHRSDICGVDNGCCDENRLEECFDAKTSDGDTVGGCVLSSFASSADCTPREACVS